MASNLYPPYLYKQELDGSYSFLSDEEIHYTITFKQNSITDPDDNLSPYIVDFSFEAGNYNLSEKRKFDRRIKATIVSILQDFFQQNPDFAIWYVCDSMDRKTRGKSRSILFERWYQEEGKDILEKYDFELIEEDLDLEIYASLLVKKYNLLIEDMLRAIQEGISEQTNKL